MLENVAVFWTPSDGKIHLDPACRAFGTVCFAGTLEEAQSVRTAGWCLWCAEHLAGTLAVGGGDDGGVDIDKALILEEAVNSARCHASHAEGCGEQVGAGTQMLNGTQEFCAVALGLQGVFGGGLAFHGDGLCLQLEGLLCAGSAYQSTFHDQCCAYILLCDFVVIGQSFALEYNLQSLVAAAVVELYKTEVLHITDVSCPAHNGDYFSVKSCAVGVNACNFLAFHL